MTETANTNFKEKTHTELLTALPNDDCCKLAFLSALAKATGTIEVSKRRINLNLTLESYEKALEIVGLLKSIYPTDFEICIDHIKGGTKKGVQMYAVQVPTGFTKQVLLDFYLMNADDEVFTAFISGVPQKFETKECCSKSYLKGLYFACGSAYVPSLGAGEEKKDGYHFELQFDDEFMAECVQHLLLNLDIASKINERGTQFLVYIKDKFEILNVLGVLGLVESALTLQSIIDEREMANSINRSTICETANLDKIFTAASKHLIAIETLEERGELQMLSSPLLEIANARKQYPQASMSELSEKLQITKSCCNHRLRRIVEIAEIH